MRIDRLPLTHAGREVPLTYRLNRRRLKFWAAGTRGERILDVPSGVDHEIDHHLPRNTGVAHFKRILRMHLRLDDRNLIKFADVEGAAVQRSFGLRRQGPARFRRLRVSLRLEAGELAFRRGSRGPKALGALGSLSEKSIGLSRRIEVRV